MPARIAAGRPTTLRVEVRKDDGALVDPGIVTVAAVRDNGASLTIAAEVGGTGAAARTVDLTAAEVGTTPDLLTITWSSTSQGTRTDHVEVVGGWIVELSALRADNGLPGTFDADQLRRGRDWFEQTAEDHCGVSFRPRYRRHTFNGEGCNQVVLPDMQIRQILWATIDGEEVDVTDWVAHSYGKLTATQTFTHGAPVSIGYLHGYDHPPADLVDVGILAVRETVGQGDRRTSVALSVTSHTGATTRNSVASTRYPTGIPAVDAVLNRHQEQ